MNTVGLDMIKFILNRDILFRLKCFGIVNELRKEVVTQLTLSIVFKANQITMITYMKWKLTSALS